jgi:hypothetical protein
MALRNDLTAAAVVRELVMSNARLWSFRTNPARPLSPPALGRLAEVKAPTLVILGEQDLPHIKEIAGLLVKGIAGARLATIPRAGHMVNLDSRDAFNRAVESFLPQPAPPVGLVGRVDHLVYATPDLQRGIDTIERLLGLKATPGGQHPGRGTRNALVALGPAAYLEIIGPDPEQPTPPQPRPFGIDGLKEPRLVTWAIKGTNLEALARDAVRGGVTLGDVIGGSRKRAVGVLLAWRYTDRRTVVAGGVVPFVIDWGPTPHPAATATPGASLVALRAEHPEAEMVQRALRVLDLDLRVQRGPRPALVATITGPRGRVELR